MKATNLESAKRVVFAATYPDTHTMEPEDLDARYGLEDLGDGSWLLLNARPNLDLRSTSAGRAARAQ